MKSVVICGSKRFKPEIRKFANNLKELGVVVFEPFLHEGKMEWKSLSEEYKNFVVMGLTHDHFQKIRMADVVYLYNKNGYCGNSCTLEIGFATALSKPIYVYSDEDIELTRNVLYREVIKRPKSLLKKLV
jgi:nucleoside 2-deoxyribosyltransferase